MSVAKRGIMRVGDLKSRTRSQVITCSPNEKLGRAAALLADEEVGAIPVLESGKMVGIVSERDICHAMAEYGNHAHKLTVADIMTRDVIVCEPDDTVNEAMAMMSRHQIRHLPVVEDDELIGMINLRSILQAAVDDARLEISVLRDYARMRAHG